MTNSVFRGAKGFVVANVAGAARRTDPASEPTPVLLGLTFKSAAADSCRGGKAGGGRGARGLAAVERGGICGGAA